MSSIFGVFFLCRPFPVGFCCVFPNPPIQFLWYDMLCPRQIIHLSEGIPLQSLVWEAQAISPRLAPWISAFCSWHAWVAEPFGDLQKFWAHPVGLSQKLAVEGFLGVLQKLRLTSIEVGRFFRIPHFCDIFSISPASIEGWPCFYRSPPRDPIWRFYRTPVRLLQNFGPSSEKFSEKGRVGDIFHQFGVFWRLRLSSPATHRSSAGIRCSCGFKGVVWFCSCLCSFCFETVPAHSHPSYYVAGNGSEGVQKLRRSFSKVLRKRFRSKKTSQNFLEAVPFRIALKSLPKHGYIYIYIYICVDT